MMYRFVSTNKMIAVAFVQAAASEREKEGQHHQNETMKLLWHHDSMREYVSTVTNGVLHNRQAFQRQVLACGMPCLQTTFWIQ